MNEIAFQKQDEGMNRRYKSGQRIKSNRTQNTSDCKRTSWIFSYSRLPPEFRIVSITQATDQIHHCHPPKLSSSSGEHHISSVREVISTVEILKATSSFGLKRSLVA